MVVLAQPFLTPVIGPLSHCPLTEPGPLGDTVPCYIPTVMLEGSSWFYLEPLVGSGKWNPFGKPLAAGSVELERQSSVLSECTISDGYLWEGGDEWSMANTLFFSPHNNALKSFLWYTER